MSARKKKKSKGKSSSRPKPAGRRNTARKARRQSPGARRKRPAKRGKPKAKPSRRPTRPTRSKRRSAAARRPKPKAKPKRLRAPKRVARGRAKARRAKKPTRPSKAQTKTQAARERERLKREREREQLKRQRERERLKKERERERAQALRERERKREAKQREAARIAAKKERERARLLKQKEKQADRARRIAEREAAREEARRIKEEERARREAEREAYRKAKEAERERLRAEREAARRALEGKVARASRRGQRTDGLLGRGGTTRVYRPDAIPDQSGTTRRGAEVRQRLVGVRAPGPPSGTEAGSAPLAAPPPAPALAPPEAPPTLTIEERQTRINERLQMTGAAFQREYRESFDMSWIYHDSALEGVVYTFQELKTAIDMSVTVVPDSSLQPVCEEIRRHRQAIELVRELGDRKRVPINVDVIKRIYITLHPEEGDVKSVKYRKDIPQHRLYFHEYAPPDKISYRVRQVVEWLNGPEPKKLKNPIRVAARVHYDLLRVFPFATDSGKVARLLMNLILLRAGYPPSIIHSTERQRYYEALKGQLPQIITMVSDAISNALMSVEKLLDDYEPTHPGSSSPAEAM